MGGDIFGGAAHRAAARGERVLRRSGVRADLGAPRPPRSARRTGQTQRGHGDPRGPEPLGDAGGRAARHHDLLDPARPGRRTGGGSSAREAVPPPRRAGRASAHGVVRHRDHDRRGAARAARRDGAEEHRDRRPGIGGHAARPAVSGLGSHGASRHRGLRLVCAHGASRSGDPSQNPNWRTRFRRSSSPR